MGQAHQVTIVLKLKSNKDKTITREKGIITKQHSLDFCESSVDIFLLVVLKI